MGTVTTRGVLSFVLVAMACRPAPGEQTEPPGTASETPAASTDDEPEPSDGGLQVAEGDEALANTPQKYDDGAYSISGLRRELDARIAEGEAGTQVLVRAYVQDIYVAPTCPPKEPCPPPKQPHVWLVDDPEEEGKREAMLLVDYRFAIPQWDAERWKGESEVELRTGERYTFKGKFVRFSDTGFAHDRGLLEFRSYRPHDSKTGEELDQWVMPPGAHWHPIVIELEEEQNRRLMEKAAEAAVQKRRKGRRGSSR